MSESLNYNIYDLLTIQINGKKQYNIVNESNLPLSFFQVDEKNRNANIVLNIGAFEPSKEGCYVVEHKYFVKHNYFYCKETLGRINFEVEISGFESGDTTINFNGKYFGPERLISAFLLQEVLLVPLLQYKLHQLQHYPVHAAGVSDDSGAYLFAGRGGASKTALVMDLIRSGFRYLGDDWTLLTADKVLPFPLVFSQFRHSIRSGRLATERSSTLQDKLDYIRFLRRNDESKGDCSFISSASIMNTLFFVTKKLTNKYSKRAISPYEAAEKLVANNELEMMKNPVIMGRKLSRFHDYMLAHSFVFPSSDVARYWDNLGRGIEQILCSSEIPIYEIVIPTRFDATSFKEIAGLVSTA